MNKLYLGTLLDHGVIPMVFNERHLCLYTAMLATSSVTKNPMDYLREIRSHICREFGQHLDISFYDISVDDVIEPLVKGTPFHLIITANSTFFSQEIQ